MNDPEPGRGVTTAIYKSELIKRIKRRNAVNPNCEILIKAPSPTDSPTRSTIEDYRTAAFEAANDATLGGENRGVFFHNDGQSFALNATASLDVNIRNTERSAAARIHPSGLGHGLIWDNTTTGGMKAVISRTKLYRKLS